jgi:hypothetical protein
MPVGFPSTPTTGQQWPTVSPRWEWDGTKWRALSTLGSGATPITERLPSIVGTDDSIWLRGGIPYLASAAAQASYFGSAPAATAPAAMTVGQWSAEPTATPGQMGINIATLPSDGGSAPTAIQYRVNGGAAVALTGTGTGLRLVTAGFTGGVPADIQVRAVNAVDADPANWSDTKTRTPAEAPVGSGDGPTVDESASTGATFSTVGSYRIATFDATGELVVTSGGEVDFLLVGGGGAGTRWSVSGGGGGGGVRRLNARTIAAGTHAIVVGSGGAVPMNADQHAAGIGDGGISSFAGEAAGGGGTGGSRDLGLAASAGRAGASGGGGGGYNDSIAPGGAGNTPDTSPAQGFAGGAGANEGITARGGGGGGAGGAGGAAVYGGASGAGGIGAIDSITGADVRYGGGGGGGGGFGNAGGAGGLGGGGSGGDGDTVLPTAGVEGLGGGGGGGGHNEQMSSVGGRGRVIVRWLA